MAATLLGIYDAVLEVAVLVNQTLHGADMPWDQLVELVQDAVFSNSTAAFALWLERFQGMYRAIQARADAEGAPTDPLRAVMDGLRGFTTPDKAPEIAGSLGFMSSDLFGAMNLDDLGAAFRVRACGLAYKAMSGWGLLPEMHQKGI